MPNSSRVSRSLRVVLAPAKDNDATRLHEASSKRGKGGLLAFVAPSKGFTESELHDIAKAAHQHLPMVRSRLEKMSSPPQGQYIRVTKDAKGFWQICVANIKINENVSNAHSRLIVLRMRPVAIQRAPRSLAEWSHATEVACRRAKQALLVRDPSVTSQEVLEADDLLMQAEACLLRDILTTL